MPKFVLKVKKTWTSDTFAKQKPIYINQLRKRGKENKAEINLRTRARIGGIVIQPEASVPSLIVRFVRQGRFCGHQTSSHSRWKGVNRYVQAFPDECPPWILTSSNEDQRRTTQLFLDNEFLFDFLDARFFVRYLGTQILHTRLIRIIGSSNWATPKMLQKKMGKPMSCESPNKSAEKINAYPF